MADRGAYRGGRAQHRGGAGGRGGGRGGHGGGAGGDQQTKERPKKENILDLSKYMDKRITVKFNGGREGKLVSSLLMSHGCAVTVVGRLQSGQLPVVSRATMLS